MAAEPERAAPKDTLDAAIVAELLGYAGAAVSLAAAALVVVNSGSISKTSASITIGLAAAGLVGAGVMLGGSSDDRAARMRSVYWFLSVIAVFELMVLLTFRDVVNIKGAITASAAVTAVVAGALWWWSRRSLQQIALFGAALLTVLTVVFPDLGSLFLGPPDFTALMVVALVAGVGWFALGWRGVVQPVRTAMVLGALSASFSPVFLSANGDASGSGVLVAIIGAVLIVAGFLVRDRAVSGIGIVGLLWGTSTLVTDLVKTSDAGSIAALVLGLVMVAASILLWQGQGGGRGRLGPAEAAAGGPPPLPVGPPAPGEPPGAPPMAGELPTAPPPPRREPPMSPPGEPPTTPLD